MSGISKKCIISLDYDGCADILFDSDYTSRYKKLVKLEERRSKFYESLNAITKGFKPEDVIWMVGAARQCYKTEGINERLNHNGCCFTNFRALAQEKPWKFDPTRFPHASGRKKRRLIHNQLIHVRKEYEGDIEFHFVDDNPRGSYIIEDVQAYLKSTGLPPHVEMYAHQCQRDRSWKLAFYQGSKTQMPYTEEAKATFDQFYQRKKLANALIVCLRNAQLTLIGRTGVSRYTQKPWGNVKALSSFLAHYGYVRDGDIIKAGQEFFVTGSAEIKTRHRGPCSKG